MRLSRCVECTGNAAASASIAATFFATVVGCGYLMFRWRLQLGIKRSFVTTAKIVVGFYSLLALVTDTFAIVYPAGFNAILAALQAAFSSIGDLSTLACALPINAYVQLLCWCCLLLALLAGICLRYLYVVGRVQTDDAASTANDDNDTTTPQRVAHRTKYTSYAFNTALIFYPFLSRASVAIFKCREVAGSLYLEVDYTIQCRDVTWYWAAAGSTVIGLVYVLGLPMYVAREVRRGSSTTHVYTEGYRTDHGRLALGWEVLEMLRKFLLTSAVIFLHQGTVSQVAVALVVSVCFLVLHVRILPFAANADNWLQGVALVALCIVYFVGLIMKALAYSDAGSPFDELLQVSSIAIFVLALAIPSCLRVKFWYRGLQKSRLLLQDAGVSDGPGSMRDPWSSGLSNTLLSSEDFHPSEEGGREVYELARDDDDVHTPQQLRAELRAMTARFHREEENCKRAQEQFQHEQEKRQREQEEHQRVAVQLADSAEEL
jgi:hypothetical protein